jgi:ribose transport system substrate-binding protein
MKMKVYLKQLCISLAAVLLFMSLPACSMETPITGGTDTDSRSERPIKPVEEIKIATILISSSSQVTAAQGNAIKEHAEELGAQCTLEYYDQNPAIQANMIENAITAGVDILILQNQSAGDCVAEINKAYEAGIIILLYGDAVTGAEYAYLFTEDAYALGHQMGTLAAIWANENLVANNKPVIAAVGNYSVTPIAANRNAGIVDALNELCPDVVIADTYEMAYKEEGLVAGENILQAHPNVNLVVGINDQSVCGVYEAFVAAGLENENIGMFGIDGTAEAMFFISKNTMFKGVLDIDPNTVGRNMVDLGIARVTGDSSASTEVLQYWDGVEVTHANINDFKYKWGELAN